MKEPTAECIAVGTFLGVELKDDVIVENLILEANDKWGDVAPDVSEGPDVESLGIFNSCKNALKCFN